MIPIPADAQYCLTALHKAGFSAYVVGGCVRDSFLGLTPKDWDICTNALPNQIKTVFDGHRFVLSGEKHGTIAVILHGEPYEVTTFRVDGEYTDHRRPDGVRFVPNVREDLSRRDFTVNAMAYNPWDGLVDAFGGRDDLRKGIIRCVGSPAQRFNEDALRILRAVRFAARYDFVLDSATRIQAEKLRFSLSHISEERIFSELDKLLLSPAAGQVLSRYGLILSGAVPEIAPCIGCTQPGIWHCYDVWQHTAAAVESLQTDDLDEQSARIVRWAVFLHDIAKPLCRTVSADGAAHFYGHNQRGAKMAREILLRLKAPACLFEKVPALVAIHDMELPVSDVDILQSLKQYGSVFLQRLCLVKYADLAAHSRTKAVEQRIQDVRRFEQDMTRLAETGCYSVRQLAVCGSDVMEAGIPAGPKLGQVLNALLDAVMRGTLPNEKSALLAAIPTLNLAE